MSLLTKISEEKIEELCKKLEDDTSINRIVLLSSHIGTDECRGEIYNYIGDTEILEEFVDEDELDNDQLTYSTLRDYEEFLVHVYGVESGCEPGHHVITLWDREKGIVCIEGRYEDLDTEWNSEFD